jgi:hypothetical protein
MLTQILKPKATQMKKIQTRPRYTTGLAAVYRNSRAVSRPSRAGAGGSGCGAANRSYRAVYRALAAVYRRRRRGRWLAVAERSLQAAYWGEGGEWSHEVSLPTCF